MEQHFPIIIYLHTSPLQHRMFPLVEITTVFVYLRHIPGNVTNLDCKRNYSSGVFITWSSTLLYYDIGHGDNLSVNISMERDGETITMQTGEQ